MVGERAWRWIKDNEMWISTEWTFDDLIKQINRERDKAYKAGFRAGKKVKQKILLCKEVAVEGAVCNYGYDCDGCLYNPNRDINQIIAELYSTK